MEFMKKALQYPWIIYICIDSPSNNKNPKYLDTHKKFAVITLKFEHGWFTIEYNASKRCRENCKQSRLWLDCLIWVYTVCPDLSFQKLRIIMVMEKYFQSEQIHCLDLQQFIKYQTHSY